MFPRIRCSPWSGFDVLGLPNMAFKFDLNLSSGAKPEAGKSMDLMDIRAGQTPTWDWRDDRMCILAQKDEDSTSHGHETQAWSALSYESLSRGGGELEVCSPLIFLNIRQVLPHFTYQSAPRSRFPALLTMRNTERTKNEVSTTRRSQKENVTSGK